MKKNKNYKDMVNWLYEKIEKYKNENDEGKAGVGYFKLASLYVINSNYDEAIKCFNEALNSFKKINFKKGEGVCYYSLGVVYLNLNNVNKSVEHFLNAENIFKELSMYDFLLRTYASLIWCYRILDMSDEAKKYLELFDDLFFTHFYREGNVCG